MNHSTRGKIWRFRKPAGSDRCENRGIAINGTKYHFRNGGTYYLGWSSQLSSTVNNNAVFQWKSYGNHVQNWPVVLKLISGKLTMIQRQPDGRVHTIWARSVSAGSWNHIVVGMRLSDQTYGGWVELWFNGARQRFNDGPSGGTAAPGTARTTPSGACTAPSTPTSTTASTT